MATAAVVTLGAYLQLELLFDTRYDGKDNRTMLTLRFMLEVIRLGAKAAQRSKAAADATRKPRVDHVRYLELAHAILRRYTLPTLVSAGRPHHRLWLLRHRAGVRASGRAVEDACGRVRGVPPWTPRRLETSC